MTVSEVAKRAGIANAEKYIDARELKDDNAIKKAAAEYTVFGRVTPVQKRKLVRALKAAGHTVAMTGDGVNDVLALKEADCGVAMASGSEVACQVAHVVLLNSDFSSMPSVVMEGRRVINNIERSASLFIVKNIFSFVFALVSLLFSFPYPVTPAQLSLVSSLTIGAPSFVLALEPNNSLVQGKFLKNVLFRALPGGLTDIVLVIGVMLFYLYFDMPQEEMSTICAILVGIVGLAVLHKTCKPYNSLRKLLMGGITVIFAIAVLFFRDWFTLVTLNISSLLVLAVFALLAYPVMRTMSTGLEHIGAHAEGEGRAKPNRGGMHLANKKK